ncbi:MAG: OmpA family protein, partial [Bacteroidota bacterium]
FSYMKNSSKNIFWASYADLMTALFIITLTLFILSYKLFRDKEAGLEILKAELLLRSDKIAEQEKELDRISSYLISEKNLADSLVMQLENEKGRLLVMEEEFRKLKEIEEAISKLDSRYFAYQPQYKRHVLKSDVQFATGSAIIKQEYHNMLENAGKALKTLMDSLENNLNIKYLLVIEGSASKDNYTRNYELSYERALQLNKLWSRQGIDFDQDKIQIIISGSGTGGIGRVAGNERLNQRFLIYIIPKVGTIDTVDWDKLKEISSGLRNEPIEE